MLLFKINIVVESELDLPEHHCEAGLRSSVGAVLRPLHRSSLQSITGLKNWSKSCLRSRRVIGLEYI